MISWARKSGLAKILDKIFSANSKAQENNKGKQQF